MSSDTVPVRTEADIQSIPTIFDAKTCTRKGLCPVTRIKNGNPLESHSLYFEQHGSGPEKILLIMGYAKLILYCMVPILKVVAQAEQHVLRVVPSGGPLRQEAGVLGARLRQQRRREQ